MKDTYMSKTTLLKAPVVIGTRYQPNDTLGIIKPIEQFSNPCANINSKYIKEVVNIATKVKIESDTLFMTNDKHNVPTSNEWLSNKIVEQGLTTREFWPSEATLVYMSN